jgi:K+-sensing histidine kinase KdpD
MLTRAPKSDTRRYGASLRAMLPVITVSLALVGLLTTGLLVASLFADVEHVTIIYLIPVLFAATRGGVLPAVLAALAGIGVSAFFFYPPIYDFRVYNPVHIVDLILYVFVAVVTGQLATNLRQAKMRADADALREALIGSVSHELRTPLSSIVGSASILAQSPEVAQNARLSSLAQVLRDEAERLNNHIQNLLDATRISSEGIRPHPEWVDPGDIVNAALERKRTMLAGHHVSVSVPSDLPLVHIDPALVEKALSQLIENAVKYSPPASPIEISVQEGERGVAIAVADQGAGLASDERERIWERLYRSPRHRDSVAGSGFGLWIARALTGACGGHIEASSPGIGLGSTFALHLPVPKAAPTSIEGTDA